MNTCIATKAMQRPCIRPMAKRLLEGHSRRGGGSTQTVNRGGALVMTPHRNVSMAAAVAVAATATTTAPPCQVCPYYKANKEEDRSDAIDDDDDDNDDKSQGKEQQSQQREISFARCGELIPSNESGQVSQQEQKNHPPMTYSVRRRILNDTLTTALDSLDGTQRLIRALCAATAQNYISLTQHAMNQSEPAYCGITTAVIVLNALSCDSVFRWKGGWRYWHESILLQNCPCLTNIETNGITMEEFHRIMVCQNVRSEMKRPKDGTIRNNQQQHHQQQQQQQDYATLDDFRQDVQRICSQEDKSTILVVTFARSHLGQTGDGHFSPIAAYDTVTDSVLVLDVARFKYPYYWVNISTLYNAMIPNDIVTNKSRGWFLLSAREKARTHLEEKRPMHAAPLVEQDPHPCPIQTIKVNYCQNQPRQQQQQQQHIPTT